MYYICIIYYGCVGPGRNRSGPVIGLASFLLVGTGCGSGPGSGPDGV
jgi:hypothetical protein